MRESTTRTRFSAHNFQSIVFRFLFLAVLAAGVAVAPNRLAFAQQAAPTTPIGTQPQSGQAAGQGLNGLSNQGATESEKEDDNVYRHTPLVQSLARIFHLDVETTARIFEFINFAIIALAIAIPLFKFLPNYLRKRGEKVRADIESARKVTEDANARLSAIEARLSGLGEEIAKFRTEVEQESVQDEARIKSTIEEESARIVAAAEQEIGAAAAQARRGLRHFAADLAIGQAAKELVLTAETDRALIAEFVGDVGRSSVGKGGQN
jgi:F-type H+-transporting ATPase subunit b